MFEKIRLKAVRQPNFFANIESLLDYPETGANNTAP